MKLQLSTVSIGIVAFTCLLVDFSLKNWEKEERVIEWDVHSYYEYLPAYFIYDDITFEKSDYHIVGNKYLFWPVFTDDGRKVIKMTMGTAYFYAPFFFVAHAYASLTDYPEDGFSEPYKVFLLLSTVFFLIIGFGFLKKILLYYHFSDKIIAVTILLLGLGTNMLCYASQSAPMSHVYSFCLFAAFIFFTIKWHQRQSLTNTIVLGFLFGWITLIRPTNCIIILFFVLYNVSTLAELKQRILFFKENWRKAIPFGIFAFLALLPQLLYWKAATGHFISYSYGDEGFFFGSPKIFEGLFGWRKGWLVYTPMMVFALAGFFLLRSETKKLKLPIIAFLILNIYIILSWWCWWYGGTLGQRTFIESYAMLAIPFASFINFISERRLIYQIAFYSVALFFIWLNIFQTYQFEFHALHYDGMSKKLYFEQFGKMDSIPDSNPHIRWPNYAAAKKGLSCDTPPSANYDLQIPDPQPGKTEVERKTIFLKAANGKYVCADGALNNIVVADRDSALGWETFTLILYENNECALMAYNNKLISVSEKKQNELFATDESPGIWAVFTCKMVDANHIVFKTANEKYIGLNEKDLRLVSEADEAGEKETFEVIYK